MKNKLACTSLLAVVLSPFAAADGVIMSNLTAPLGVGTCFASGCTTMYKAYGFTMGPAAAPLEEVILSMDFPNAGADPVVSIWSDAAGLPGVELIELVDPGVLAGQADYSFTPPAPFMFAANTTYWVHVRPFDMLGPQFLWDGTNPNTPPSGTGTHVGYIFNGSPSGFNNRLEVRCPTAGPLGVVDAACIVLPNSTGASASISLFGSGNAGDVVEGTARQGPPGEFGYFISGPNPGLYIVPPGSTGIICIGNPQFRYNSASLGQVFQFDGAGISSAVVGGGPSLLPTDGSYAPVPAVAAGESRAFQAWFRDGATSNFSESKIHTFN